VSFTRNPHESRFVSWLDTNSYFISPFESCPHTNFSVNMRNCVVDDSKWNKCGISVRDCDLNPSHNNKMKEKVRLTAIFTIKNSLTVNHHFLFVFYYYNSLRSELASTYNYCWYEFEFVSHFISMKWSGERKETRKRIWSHRLEVETAFLLPFDHHPLKLNTILVDHF